MRCFQPLNHSAVLCRGLFLINTMHKTITLLVFSMVTDEQNVSLSVPSAVENLTVVSVTTESILLSWSKPVGDSDFYSVEYRKQNESQTQKSKCKDSNECNVTGLSPGFEYSFTVKAIVNDNIEGVSSSVSDYTSKCRKFHTWLYHERTSIAMFPVANVTLLCAKLEYQQTDVD